MSPEEPGTEMAAVANRNRKKNFARVDGQSGDTFVPPQEEERGRNR